MELKVYYIDDEIDLCELFSDLFSAANVKVTTFTSAHQAIEAVNQDVPHVIFMDYRMPEMNGIELAKKLPEDIKKYLATGENSYPTEYPFEGFLKKPFDSKVIRNILKQLAVVS